MSEMTSITRVFLSLEVKSENFFCYGSGASGKVNWRYKRYRQTWQNMLAIKMGRPDHPVDFKVFLRVTSVKKHSRKFDHSNLVGGAKPIPDALKRLGWIVDDSPAWLVDEYHQTKGDVAGTFIELYRMPSAQLALPGGYIIESIMDILGYAVVNNLKTVSLGVVRS